MRTRNTISSGSRFIWDELDNRQYSDKNNDDGIDTITYFSIPTTARRAQTEMRRKHDHDDGLSSPTSKVSGKSLSTVVTEIKGKVDMMKEELAITIKKIKEEELTLTRLQHAKQRSIEKFKRYWTTKIKDLKEEHSAAIAKQKEFLERLETDTKKLQSKQEALKEKISKAKHSKELSIELFKDEARKKRARARRQWEADEKIYMDKVIKSKEEQMKKAIADSFGPKIDKLVLNGKEEVRAKTDELEQKLLTLKQQLASEMESKVSEALDRIRDDSRNDDEKIRKQGERRLEEALRKQTDEIISLRERYARERKMAEENAERTRRVDAEAALESIRSIRKNETQHIEELMASQQREIAKILQVHAEEITDLQKSLRKEEEMFEEKCKNMLTHQQTIQDEKARALAMSRAAAETEEILNKVKQEVVEERAKIKKAIDFEIEDLRVQVEQRLDNIMTSEKRSIERAGQLKSEIDGLQRTITNTQQLLEPKEKKLIDIKTNLSSLRLTLKDVEEEVTRVDNRLENEYEKSTRKQNKEIEKLKLKEKELMEKLSRQETMIANAKDDAKAEMSDELKRIRDKISSLISKKDIAEKELRRQLAVIQQRTSEIQQQVDKKRESQYV